MITVNTVTYCTVCKISLLKKCVAYLIISLMFISQSHFVSVKMGNILTDDIEYFVMFSFITACLCVCCCCCPSRSEDENEEVETGAISRQTNTQILSDRQQDIEQISMEFTNFEVNSPAYGHQSLPDQIWSTGLEYRNESQGKKDEENLAPPSYDEAIQS